MPFFRNFTYYIDKRNWKYFFSDVEFGIIVVVALSIINYQLSITKMPHYHKSGSIPHKRHTQFRKPDGDLYSEQLFSTEGFSIGFFITVPYASADTDY